MALTQAQYRFGDNTGTEATHGFLAAQNTPINRDASDLSTFLCRILVQASGGVAHNNQTIQWQFSLNGGAFTNITTTSDTVKAVATSVFADQASPTNRLTGGTGTFESSSQTCTHDGNTGGAQCDIVANGFAETVCALQLVSGVVPGDTIDLRVTATAGIGTYSQVARINVTGAVTVLLDTAAAAVSAEDAPASASVTLDVAAFSSAAADISAVNTVLVQVDTAAITAGAADVPGAVLVGIETVAAVSAAGDLQARSTIALDVAGAVAAGADVTPVEAGAVVLDTAAITLAAADVLAQVTEVTLEGVSVAVIVGDLALNAWVSLDTAAALTAAGNMNPVSVGPHMPTSVVLDTAAVAVAAADVPAAERLLWQAFTVAFAEPQNFANVGFGWTQQFEVAA